MEYRIEHDSMGEVKVPADKYWAAQTERSHENFLIGVGIGMQLFAVLLYAWIGRKARGGAIVIEIALSSVGAGLIIAAHPVAAEFSVAADCLISVLAPFAVLTLACLLLLCAPRIKRAVSIGCLTLIACIAVLFAVLWWQSGPEDYAVPLYGTLVVLFYAFIFFGEDDGKYIGDFLFCASLGAFALIFVMVLAFVSEGECCSSCDCCEPPALAADKIRRRK